MSEEQNRAQTGPTVNKRPTAYDVARLAGVSQSMVSRAFTPGGSVSPEARSKVIEAARQLRYRPNLIARSLITQRSRLIGVAMTYMENQFYPAVLELLSEFFGDLGFKVILFTPGSGGDSDPVLEEVLRFQVAAIILASTSLSSHFAEECAAANVPVVLFNRRSEDRVASTVVGQNRSGGGVVGRFLLAGGHTRFAYIAGLDDSSTSREREQGYLEALGEAGTRPTHRRVGSYDFHAAQEAARDMLSARARPDAIFCANDHMAIAVLQTARYEFGLDVGREISIVGFDDVSLAAWPAFSLTTFSQPVRSMARRVVDVTLRCIEGDGSGPIHDVVPGELVVRTSARLPPRAWKPVVD